MKRAFLSFKTTTPLIMGLLSLFLTGSLGVYYDRLHHHIEKLEHQLQSLKHLTVRAQETVNLINTFGHEFTAFEGCGFATPITPETLQKSMAYPLEFGPISSVNKDPNHCLLVSQEISFSLACTRDREVYLFLDQLITQGPGIFRIQEVSIDRLSPLTETMLEKIATGDPVALFEARIFTTWIHR